MSAPGRPVEVIARELRHVVARGERIQKELDRFQTNYPTYTRALELLRQALAENLEQARALERELAGAP
jgi:uncharacterized protein involved in exopolysaccharide biosynthesis